jgi:hypothetical protein
VKDIGRTCSGCWPLIPGDWNCVMRSWRRPALPRLEPEYHGRWRVSRPSSGWDRVGPRRFCHQDGIKQFQLSVVSFLWPVFSGQFSVASFLWPVFSGQFSVVRARSRRPVVFLATGDLQLTSDYWFLRSDQADRTISTAQLKRLPALHMPPIDVVVYHGSHARPGFEVGFPLRCFQRLSRPYIATLLRGWRHDRSTRGTSIPVLSY